jgi:hypothetical protein
MTTMIAIARVIERETTIVRERIREYEVTEHDDPRVIDLDAHALAAVRASRRIGPKSTTRAVETTRREPLLLADGRADR